MSRYYRRNRKRGGGKKRQRNGNSGGIFTNRRRPESSWISLYDIYLNSKERLYSFFYGVPEGSFIRWNNKGKIVGHISKAPRPWFSKKR